MRDGIFQVTVPDISGANKHVREQFAPHEISSFLLHTGVSVTTDALHLALDNEVDILLVDTLGNIKGRLWPTRPSSTLLLWKNQLELSHRIEGLRIAKEWIVDKIQSRLEHLRKLKSYRTPDKVQIISAAEVRMLELLGKLRQFNPVDFDTGAKRIRALEGAAGRHYFDTLSDLLPEEYSFKGRNARPATDAFNAFLNYGYGILYSKVEKALLTAGLHPHIGFMHADGYQRKTLVFDFIECFRNWIEKIVFKLFSGKKVSSGLMTYQTDEGLWLAEGGRRLMAEAVKHKFSHKRLMMNGRFFPLDGYIMESARRLAGMLLQWNKTAVVPVGAVGG